MAKGNSSRGKRQSGRSGGNRPRTHPKSLESPLDVQLRAFASVLDATYSTCATVQLALRHQNGDFDIDIERCLRLNVASPVRVVAQSLRELADKLRTARGER